MTASKELVPALALADALMREAAQQHGADSGCMAQALLLRATVLQVMGRFEDAGQPFDDAVALFRMHVPADHPALTLALNNQGAQRYWMRRYVEAAQSHEEALERRRRAVPVDELAVAESLQNLADAYRFMGRPADLLIRIYKEVIEVRSRRLSPNDKLVANSRQNLASAYELANNEAAARTELNEALRIYRQNQPREENVIAGVLNRLAAREFLHGRFAAAETLYRDAVTTLRTVENDQKIALAVALDDFAVNQMRLSKPDDARALALEALAVRTTLLPPTHASFARTLSNLSEIDWLQGRFPASLEAARKATDITLLAPAFDTAARLRLQRHVKALWWSATPPGTPPAVDQVGEAFTVAQHATHSDTANTVRNLAARAAASNPQLRALLKVIDDIEHDQERLETRLSQAASATTGADGQKTFADLRAAAAELGKRRAAALATVRRQFPKYDQLVRPEPLSPADVQRWLGPDEALVKFLVGLDDVFVFAVTRESVVMRQVAVTPHDLAGSVGKLRAALQVEPTSTQRHHAQQPLFNLGVAHDLYTKLFGDLAPVLAGKTRLIVVPSASLTSLPFHLLVLEPPRIAQPTRKQATAYREAKWLVRRHAITILPSVESLRALRIGSAAAASERRPLLAFANPLPRAAPPVQVADNASARVIRGTLRKRGVPDLWSGGAVQLEALRAFLADPAHQLPETVDEVTVVARTLRADPQDIFSGGIATEAAIKKMDLSKFRVVYFATHGFVTGTFGIGEPSLALTAPDTATADDDGLLTASEITALKLDADLVVLSACDTAAGDKVGAEGLSGLARAFFHAGARSMLVSHWAVDSLDTKALMQSMFLQLEREPQLQFSEAFRRAMLARVTGATGPDAWNAYPGRWAPFDLVGVN